MFRKKRISLKDYDNPEKIPKVDLNIIRPGTRKLPIKFSWEICNSPYYVWKRLFHDLHAVSLVDEYGRCFKREDYNIFKNCVDDHEHLDIYIPDEY